MLPGVACPLKGRLCWGTHSLRALCGACAAGQTSCWGSAGSGGVPAMMSHCGGLGWGWSLECCLWWGVTLVL